MSQTISQLIKLHPKAGACTKHLEHNPKFRRVVIETIEKLRENTAPSDLAEKVIKELSTLKSLQWCFGDYALDKYGKDGVIWNRLRPSVMLAVKAFNGDLVKDEYEANYHFQKAKRSNALTTKSVGLAVLTSNQEDNFRVYVTDPTVEVCLADDVIPYSLMDRKTKDRSKFKTPREVCLVKMNPVQTLLLFREKGASQQRRFLISNDRVQGFNFQPIGSAYQQVGTTIEKKLDTVPVETNSLGDLIETRSGLTPQVFMIDMCNRGPMGETGPRGPKGEKGEDGDSGRSLLEQLANAKVDTVIDPAASPEKKMNQLFSLLLVKCARDKLAGYDIRGEAIAKREHEWNMKAIRGEPQ
jgi:hypothetical protein